MKELRGPLDELLKNGTVSKWENIHQESFDKLKNILSSNLVLTHVDPNKDIVLATDASKYGMGAALMHRFKDGSLHPIMHFTATFNTAEKNYSQIEKKSPSTYLWAKAVSLLYSRATHYRTCWPQALVGYFRFKNGHSCLHCQQVATLGSCGDGIRHKICIYRHQQFLLCRRCFSPYVTTNKTRRRYCCSSYPHPWKRWGDALLCHSVSQWSSNHVQRYPRCN